MIGTAIAFIFGGLGKLFRGLLGLVREYPWQSAVVILAISLLVMFRQWGLDHRDLTDKLAEANGRIAEEREAHEQTVRNVDQGRKAAAELDRKNVKRVKAEADAINERITDELETRTSTYAARNDRLRGRLAALEATAGGSGATDLSADPDATCRAFGAADCEDFAARMTDAQSSIDRLIALQDWARGVAGIEVNGE